ncbi:hypothetical protein [Chitiniphilus shinanonensis]|uniref:hypothetical protein n=1 Tax=Chitiniphilus shinanonensis TaxID=553088 RepID=UPI00333E84EF
MSEHDDLPHNEALSRHYRALPPLAPSAGLDAAIRAAAHRAVTPRRSGILARLRLGSGPGWAAVCATLVIGGFAYQLWQGMRPAPTAIQGEPPADSAPATAQPEQQPAIVAEAMPNAAAKQETIAGAPRAAPKRERAPQPPAARAPAQAPAQTPAPAAPEPAAQDSLAAAPAPSMDFYYTPPAEAVAEAPAPAPAPVAPLQRQREAQAMRAPPAPAPYAAKAHADEVAPFAASEPASLPEALARVRALLARGDLDGARAAWQALRRHHPAGELPDDLRRRFEDGDAPAASAPD